MDFYCKEIDLKWFCCVCILMVKGDFVERYFMVFLLIRVIMVIDIVYWYLRDNWVMCLRIVIIVLYMLMFY